MTPSEAIPLHLEQAFRAAVRAVDPETRVARALAARQASGKASTAARVGVAVGKAALAMARGIGVVARGIAVAPVADGAAVPAGWRVLLASHPEPDARSVAAGEAVVALLAGTHADDDAIVAISGGASALLEVPRTSLAVLRDAAREAMARGAPIAELNAVRALHSRIKGGQLAALTPARITTLVASDVVGDPVAVIGSGPTVDPATGGPARSGDTVVLVAPIGAFADAIVAALGPAAFRLEPPLVEEVEGAAARILAARTPGRIVVAYGEPTVRVPAGSGTGGRAQHLALILARALRGTAHVALVAGSDGIDGPPPPDRPDPAGALVDGTTWDAIGRAGIDPDAALARRDAGTALAAIGALLVIGPTGVNHADVVILV